MKRKLKEKEKERNDWKEERDEREEGRRRAYKGNVAEIC
jgi:hypothetical protein